MDNKSDKQELNSIERKLDKINSEVIEVDQELKESTSEVKRIEKMLSILLLKIEEYSGPIPSASEMEKYSKISPKLVDRIMQLTEKNNRIGIIEKIKKFRLSKEIHY